MKKTLDVKLGMLERDPDANVFILADAKDADMGFGVCCPGPAPTGAAQAYRSLAEYRDEMRTIVKQGLVDLMLMSPSSSELLALNERLFDNSPVTAAARCNDTTDIWLANTAQYTQQPSLPFRTTTIEHVQCGHLDCSTIEKVRGVNLGLYSITLNHDARLDRDSLENYRAFRLEAEQFGFRHFLEVFSPNALGTRPLEQPAAFMIDSIARLLAGITRVGRPVFLKIPYLGRRAISALRHYDPSLVIGVLGGGSGTTRDAFQLIENAKSAGARAAIFGRKINHAEHQPLMVQHLRAVADGDLSAEEATESYHHQLQSRGISPQRPLASDRLVTDATLIDDA